MTIRALDPSATAALRHCDIMTLWHCGTAHPILKSTEIGFDSDELSNRKLSEEQNGDHDNNMETNSDSENANEKENVIEKIMYKKKTKYCSVFFSINFEQRIF